MEEIMRSAILNILTVRMGSHLHSLVSKKDFLRLRCSGGGDRAVVCLSLTSLAVCV